MYFWNVERLIEDLKNNQVTEREFKNYYMVSSFLVLLTFFILAQMPAADIKIQFASFLIQFGLLITWINLIFKANHGDQGKQFVSRIIALYLPIGIRVTVFAVILWSFGEYITKDYKIQESPERVYLIEQVKDCAFDVIVSFIIYWRIYVAIQKVNH